MANQLKMALVETIFTLYQRGWSQRRIAQELGIHRDSVARYLRQAADPKPAIAPTGSDPPDADSKPAIAPIGSEVALTNSKPAIAPTGSEAIAAPVRSGPGRPSDCAPWRAVIVAKLAVGLSAQRIYQDLISEQGCTASYYSVRRFVASLGAAPELPFRRLECGPGEEAQVDFGSGAPLLRADGKRQRTHVFRIVLSHSRKAYSEVVTRQATDNFLHCLENAFWHFGGAVQRIVLDNLRAAVSQADWFEPELNPKVQSFAHHYGTVFLPTRPYTPRHKGKVERGIDYVQENALKGRRFSSVQEQNRFLLDWEQSVADTRIHGTTRQQVGKVFVEVERPALLALPVERFANFQEGQRQVNRDGHIEVAHAYYSLPAEYLRRRVWVRWDGRLVRIFNDRLEQIAVHVQVQPGRFSTHEQHIASAKISNVERGAVWLLGKVRRVGPHSAAWAEGVIATRGIEGVRVLQGLLNLTGRYRSRHLEHACEIAHSYRCYRLRTIRALLKREAPKQSEFEFMAEHPLIRPLSAYEEFVHDVFQKGACS